MRLTEILKPQNIKVPLESKTKSEAIAELVNLLAANKEIGDAKKVLDSVLERESTRTTGIGNGVAVPHTKHPAVTRAIGVLGLCRNAVNFDSIDGRPLGKANFVLRDSRGRVWLTVTTMVSTRLEPDTGA